MHFGQQRSVFVPGISEIFLHFMFAMLLKIKLPFCYIRISCKYGLQRSKHNPSLENALLKIIHQLSLSRPQDQHISSNIFFPQIFIQEFASVCFCFIPLLFSVDKKNQLDVTFCILYFSSNSCSTCFGQPCAHHQELTTA